MVTRSREPNRSVRRQGDLKRLSWAAGLAWGATLVGVIIEPGVTTVLPCLVTGGAAAYALVTRRRGLSAEPSSAERLRPSRIVRLPTPNAKTPPPVSPHHSVMPVTQRALLIDENVVSQTVSRHMLTALGYTVETARDAGSAVVALSKRPFTLVLAKQPMDGVDGQALRQHVLQVMHQYDAPLFIAVTAAASNESRNACLNSGFDEVLAQPLTPTALRAVLERDASLGAPVPTPAANALDTALTIDPAVLADFGYSLDDKEELDEFLELFMSESHSKLATLEASFSRGDWSAVTRVAHALKGSSGVTGAVRLSQAAARLEIAAKSGDPVEIIEGMQKVRDEFQRVESRFASQAA